MLSSLFEQRISKKGPLNIITQTSKGHLETVKVQDFSIFIHKTMEVAVHTLFSAVCLKITQT